LDEGGNRASSPSEVIKKLRFPKPMCAPRTQLTPWLAIHGLMKAMKCAKGPTKCANCQRFIPPTSKFVFAHVA
jgi:hypothetical protein